MRCCRRQQRQPVAVNNHFNIAYNLNCGAARIWGTGNFAAHYFKHRYCIDSLIDLPTLKISQWPYDYWPVSSVLAVSLA